MTDVDLHKLIADAVEHDRRATPGPWRVNPDFPLTEGGYGVRPTESQEAVFGPEMVDHGYGSGPEPDVVIGSTWYDGPHTLVSVKDAAAIALYRTAAPQLATALRDALDREQAIQEAMREIDGGSHVTGDDTLALRATYARKLEERRRDR